MFRVEKFEEKRFEKGLTLGQVAAFIGVREATLRRKLADCGDFTRNEIQLLWHRLELSGKEMEDIFFAKELA